MNQQLQKVEKFYSAIREDGRISPSHISLYMGLFYCWMKNGFDSPVSFNGAQIMRISKISGRATYIRCIRDLHEFGHIRYVPSHNPFLGSQAYL